MKKKRIFITGIAGFIGFHLAQKLHLMGYQVMGYDNFNDYYSVALKNARAAVLRQSGIEIVKGDLIEEAHLKHSIIEHQTTHLVHLAAQAGVRYSLENPKSYLKSNIEGFLNILEICRELPHLKLTYASSSSVYGLNQKVPYSILDNTDQQASFYGNTKKTNELMASTYHHLFGISVTGLRFFTVYGPWGRPDMAYFIFTKAILENKPIEVYGNGELKRDFTYIDDIIDGTVAAIEEELPFALFNLGNKQPASVLELISHLEDLLEKKAIKKFLPIQQGDVISTFADITESERVLSFHPKFSLHQGLKKFVNWYQDYIVNSL